jgi:hypothetical protein
MFSIHAPLLRVAPMEESAIRLLFVSSFVVQRGVLFAQIPPLGY